MVDRDGGRDAGLRENAGRLVGQIFDLGLGAVGHVWAAHHGDILLRDEVRDQMRLRSVDDDRAQAELL